MDYAWSVELLGVASLSSEGKGLRVSGRGSLCVRRRFPRRDWVRRTGLRGVVVQGVLLRLPASPIAARGVGHSAMEP